jgi:DNA-binding CsgD family transcriptional regulator/PAS domain-containing protein
MLRETLDTIEEIYEAAGSGHGWDEALAHIAHATGGKGLLVNPLSSGTLIPDMLTSELREAIADYEAYWRPFDTRTNKVLRLGITNGLVTDRTLGIDRETAAKDPFIQEFLKSYEIGSFAAQIFRTTDGALFGVGVQRDIRLGDFDERQLRDISLLGRHLTRAFDLAGKLARTGASAVADGFDRFGQGVLVLDETGHVVEMNETVKKMIGKGFIYRHRRLTASDPGNASLLGAFFGRIRGYLNGGPVAEPILMPPCPNHGPVLLQMIPLRSSSAFQLLQPLRERHGVIVLIADLRSTRKVDMDGRLVQLGLTTNEASVARDVGSGASPRDVADQKQISEGTVRFVLKSIYRKLGISKQSELAVLITKLAASLAEVEDRRAPSRTDEVSTSSKPRR